MIEKAAGVLLRHDVGEGFMDGESGDFHCRCGRRFVGKRAMREWAEHVARCLRRAAVLR